MIDPFDTFNVPFVAVFILLGMAILAKNISKLLTKLSSSFGLLNYNKQVKCVIYSLELMVCPIMLIIIAHTFIFFNHEIENITVMVHYIAIAIIIGTMMYLFEIIYDHHINNTLFLHHILTIINICLLTNWIYYFSYIQIINIACLQLFFIPSESPIFIFMLNYRLDLGINNVHIKMAFIIYYIISRMIINGYIYYYFYKLYNLTSNVIDDKYWTYYSISIIIASALCFVQVYVVNIYKIIMFKPK